MYKTTLSLSLAALSLIAFPLSAQAPYLVKDINTTVSTETKSSISNSFISFRNKIYFVATTDQQGTELWSTDGTPGGTAILNDIVPGNASSNPSLFTVLNNVLLFDARDADHGIEFWATDGTAAGTHLLVDINPGPGSSQPGARIVYNDKLLFAADDGTTGRELWISDGTAGGTKLLKDINPGSIGSFPNSFFRFGNSVYFSASNALWKTDGTEGGTVKLADIFPRNWVQLGSRLFFEAIPTTTGGGGWELWTTDGSAAGTSMVVDINPDGNGIDVNSQTVPIVIGDKMLFFATDGTHGREMWVSDGTASGTHMVRDFVPGAKGMWDGSTYVPMIALNGRAYFTAHDDEHGQELWVTDGTDAGTSLFMDLNPGSASSNPYLPLAFGSKFLFATSSPIFPAGGATLWISDGTVAGTHHVTDQVGISSSGGLSIIGEKLYFSGASSLYGSEPWVSDGTDAGTHLIANIGPDRAPSSVPSYLTAAGNQLFFFARSDNPGPNSYSALWRTDGTEAGTYKIFDPTRTYERPLIAGSSILFTDRSPTPSVLRVSDGTPGGANIADSFLAHFGGKTPETLWSFGNTIFAKIYNSSGQSSWDTTLWTMTAGSDAPGVQLGPTAPINLVELCGRYLFFAQGSGIYNYGLWTTDGTRAGTYAIYPQFGDGGSSGAGKLVVAGGTAYFLLSLRDQNVKLWKSDGTLDGTAPVKELTNESTAGDPIVAVGRRVFFASGGTLWTSDGTEAGTIVLRPVSVKQNSALNLAAAGNRLVFNFVNDAQEVELWTSDGTVDGTRLLLKPGNGFRDLTTIDGMVYFNASDDLHGHELWSSDGTPEGTKLVYDLNPGPASSDPTEPTKVGNTIFFAAYTDAVGNELWALPVTQPQLSINDVHATEGDSGTTTARFTVTLAPAAKGAVTVDWKTSDGTAKAGEDYDAANGTLTFAAGETSKTIDVRVRGDVVPENNETFFVALSNSGAAGIVRGEGAASIEDDDQAADLSTSLSFKEGPSIHISNSVNISNAGPRGASEISLKITKTPGDVGEQTCYACYVPQLLPGASVLAGTHQNTAPQQYFAATATAKQRDPQPANNTTTWTSDQFESILMTPSYVTVGGTATVAIQVTAQGTTPTSSDPSVVAVSSMTKSSSTYGTFTVTGLKAGTSTISVAGQDPKLLVTVVAAGTQPRWPGGVLASGDYTSLLFHRPLNITIYTAGVAPFSGATATGTIVVTTKGQEVARKTITGPKFTFPVYMPTLGQNDYTISYSGDANFLPSTSNASVFVYKGTASMYATLEPVTGAAGTFRLTVHTSGSPLAAPSGALSILNGATEVAKGTLASTGDGASSAQFTIANLPPYPTLTLKYLGDDFYEPATLQVRTTISKPHAVGR